jgi:hypothetical protein
MIEQIENLIKTTEQWREYHRQNHNVIEASACAIRLAALRETYEIVRKNQNHS